MTDTRVKVGLAEGVLRQVDERRGLVARERWIRAAIEHYLVCDRLAVPVNTGVAGGTRKASPTPARQPVPKDGRPHRHRPKSTNSGWVCTECGEAIYMGPSGL